MNMLNVSRKQDNVAKTKRGQGYSTPRMGQNPLYQSAGPYHSEKYCNPTELLLYALSYDCSQRNRTGKHYTFFNKQPLNKQLGLN